MVKPTRCLLPTAYHLPSNLHWGNWGINLCLFFPCETPAVLVNELVIKTEEARAIKIALLIKAVIAYSYKVYLQVD